jgi:hypothetical protein
VPGRADLGPPPDRLGLAEHGRELSAPDRVELRGKDRAEDENGKGQAGTTQLLAFLQRSDTESPGLEVEERVRDANRTEAVRVGLDHRQERNRGGAREPLRITHQRAEVDLDPGARHQPWH